MLWKTAGYYLFTIAEKKLWKLPESNMQYIYAFVKWEGDYPRAKGVKKDTKTLKKQMQNNAIG